MAGVSEGTKSHVGLRKNWGPSTTGDKRVGANRYQSSWILNIAPAHCKLTSFKFSHNSQQLYEVLLGF